jgi:hypothetical protein
MSKTTQRVLRASGVLAGAGMLTLATTGAAFAHECYVANRSAQGNAMAGSHSQAWETVSLDTILTQFLGLTDSVASCVEGMAPAAGIPDSFVFGGKQAVGQGGVIAENNPNMTADRLAADGKGIDHAEDAYGDAIGALIGQCSPG